MTLCCFPLFYIINGIFLSFEVFVGKNNVFAVCISGCFPDILDYTPAKISGQLVNLSITYKFDNLLCIFNQANFL